MAVKTKHSSEYSTYFCTFTCYQWLYLFDLTNGYDLVYKWFNYLVNNKNANVIAYVIMPNHLHSILHFPDENFELDKTIGNAKRFMAYEIIERLQLQNHTAILKLLSDSVSNRERKKGQLHKVFEDSFDAKSIYTEKIMHQKIDYIHNNPISGKWNLAKDITEYEHSSASFYELGIIKRFKPTHYLDV
jgi:putative transposase